MKSNALDRILETPQLARLVPQLLPEVLHRVIDSCGLEDCAELVALATPAQLSAVFDLDLWRPAEPGLDEQFDADRFGVWLEVMLECGAEVAAEKLAGVDADLTTTAFAQYVRVFDPASLLPAAQSDDEEMPKPGTSRDGISCEIGGYLVVARRGEAWDAIVSLLTALEAGHSSCFHRVMAGCRTLSNSTPEADLPDLLPHHEQVMFDLSFEREQRREQQGYVSPPQARAFLQMSRHVRQGQEAAGPANPVARAYFRAMEPAAASDPAALQSANAVAISGLIDLLVDAGVLPQQPRALLDGPQGTAPRLARIHAQMRFAAEHDEHAYSLRTQELAYLANTLLSGCPVQTRPFTAREAWDAAVATCNLGLENWPQPLPDDFLVSRDLVPVFQIGWTVLHEDVCMYAAAELIDVLTRVRCGDREVQAGLDALRREMADERRGGTPWRARNALDVLMFLDMPAWAALAGLIDECPVIHAGVAARRGSPTRSVSASAFDFISENSQVAAVREFMQSLPETLSDAG